MTTIRRLSLGPIETNCYILRQDNQALIIDPSGEPEQIKKALTQSNLQPVAVLLTHAHFDHIGALDEIVSHYDLPVYIHQAEVKWLADPLLNGSGKYAELPNISSTVVPEKLAQGEFTIGKFSMTVLETPGHSPGSLSFYFKEQGFIVSGDVLFQGSIGRTDLRGGDLKVLMQSITRKLLVLPEDTIVYSGHGIETTIENEMMSNPFLNGFNV